MELQAPQAEATRLGYRGAGKGGSDAAAPIGGIRIHVEYFAFAALEGSAASEKGGLGYCAPPRFREPAKELPRGEVGSEQGTELGASPGLVEGA